MCMHSCRSHDAPLGRMMKRIAARYSRYKHRKLNTTGHLFERRYKALLADADAALHTFEPRRRWFSSPGHPTTHARFTRIGSCVTQLRLLSPCGQAARFDRSVRPASFGAEDSFGAYSYRR
jgi:hypothetical protein